MSNSMDFICSIGELVDKLTIENIKCSRFNHEMIELKNNEPINLQRIGELQISLMAANEQRVRLKNEINLRIDDAIRRGGIGINKETRTYRL